MRTHSLVIWTATVAVYAALMLCLHGCRPAPANPDRAFDEAQLRYWDLVAAADVADPIAEPGDDGQLPEFLPPIDAEPVPVEELPAPIEVAACPCLTGGPCACEANGCVCQCGPKPSHRLYEQLPPQCIVAFTDNPGALQDQLGRLRDAGWAIRRIDETVAWHWCDIKTFPTFVCLRRGFECGRQEGNDWTALCAMLRRANQLRFPEDGP